jgi:hypothetical protein
MPSTRFARSVRRVSALMGLLVVFVTPYETYAADRPEGKAQPRAKAPAAKQVGRLTVAIPADFANLEPYTAGQSTADFVMELVFDKLYSPLLTSLSRNRGWPRARNPAATAAPAWCACARAFCGTMAAPSQLRM